MSDYTIILAELIKAIQALQLQVTNTVTIDAQTLLDTLKSIDGHGSGLDADTIDGLELTDLSQSGHTHDSLVSGATDKIIPLSGASGFDILVGDNGILRIGNAQEKALSISMADTITDIYKLRLTSDTWLNNIGPNKVLVTDSNSMLVAQDSLAMQQRTFTLRAPDLPAGASHVLVIRNTGNNKIYSVLDVTLVFGHSTSPTRTILYRESACVILERDMASAIHGTNVITNYTTDGGTVTIDGGINLKYIITNTSPLKFFQGAAIVTAYTERANEIDVYFE